MTSDYEKFLAMQKERNELLDDRRALRIKVTNLRRDVKDWQEKATRYRDALLAMNARQGGPADDGVGRAWLADLGATGGD